ncbi:MAG: UbiH/UbiF/VisC/COQ6 family ubiquinone biosynthesis hydroxylase [Woeseiaceae bacterium]
MTRDFRIVVAGAGVAGLTVASLLAQSARADRLRLTVVDAAPRPVFDKDDDVALRVSAIAQGSADLLAGIGAWHEVVSTRACAYDHMRVWDEADSPDGDATLSFDADEFVVPHLGYIVENALLRHALIGVLESLDVDLRFGTAIESVTPREETHRILLSAGGGLDADLVIAADGARSPVRESLGIDVSRLAYEQTAFVTHLIPDHAHGHTAWQRFLRQGPIGMLPLDDGRISVVWSTSPEKAEEAMGMDDDALGGCLSDVTDRALGELRVAGPRGAFPLAAQHAAEYVKCGVALIGDAAHTVHPLAGQGANLGLQDAEGLAAVVIAALEAGENPADRPVLRRYERARKGANAAMMHFMTGLNRLFASDSQVVGEVRRAGMKLFNKAGPIRNRVVGVALGAGRR